MPTDPYIAEQLEAAPDIAPNLEWTYRDGACIVCAAERGQDHTDECELNILLGAFDLQAGRLEDAKQALNFCADRMDEFTYSELACPLDDGELDQWGEEYISERNRLRLIVDHTLTYKDLETKFRDGTFDLRAVLGEGSQPATRFLAAVMWHAILGDAGGDPNEPPNYMATEFFLPDVAADQEFLATSMEWFITPAGTFQKLGAAIEVVKPGGKSSHQIRLDLEAELAELRGDADG